MARTLLQRITNRLLHLAARIGPGATTARPCLHRWRGVKVGPGVFIGEGVYLENEHPDCVEVEENVQISIRAIIVAHTRGPGRVIIEKGAFLGPNCVVICGAGRVLRIGAGAVIGAGCVVTKSVPPRLYLASPAPRAVARVTVPLPDAQSIAHFWAGLEPLGDGPAQDESAPPSSGGRTRPDGNARL